MTEEIYVKSLDVLRELEIAVGHFATVTQETLETLELEIHRSREVLEERRIFWKRTKHYWERVYEEAEDEEAIKEAIWKIEEAEAEIRRLELWQRKVEESYQVYRRRTDRLRELASESAPKTRAYLRRKISELEDYLAVPVPAAPEAAPPAAGVLTTAGGEIMAPAPSFAELTGFSLPPGFYWVPLAEIDQSDLPGEDEFQKVSAEEMKKGFQTLREEILPALQKGADKDYFRAQDEKQRKSSPAGALRVYEAFFGKMDPVHLSRFTDEKFYSVDNGRHRIRVAQELGWPAVPAEVKEVPRPK